MKFTTKSVTSGVNILANDHYVGMPYNCGELTDLAADGIIPAGTIIPANDDTALGVLLHDVTIADNPNGTIVIHGFIAKDKLPEAPTEDGTGTDGKATVGATTALKQITFM